MTSYQEINFISNIYNIFSAIVPLNSVPKILESASSRKTINYIPQNVLWRNRLFVELANRNHKHYLTIDFSGINKDGPGRFRTEADNPEFQTCYFNLPNDEQIYNKFVSKRINSAEDNENLHFEIIKVKSRTNKTR